MTPRTPTSSFVRTARRRRGYFALEMLITLMLTAVVATFATQVMMRVLATDHVLGDAERADASLGQAVRRLRRDVERATNVTAADGELTIGAATWSVGPNQLVRREGNSFDAFDDLRETPQLTAAGGVVTLRVGRREWAFAVLTDGGGR